MTAGGTGKREHDRSRMPTAAARAVWLLLLAFALVAQLVGLYSPSGGGPSPFPHSDKVFHAAAFAAVTACALLAGLPARWVLGLGAAHAVASEIVQGLFLENRSGDVLDVLADLVGVALGWAVAACAQAVAVRGTTDGTENPA